jgi:hypothetical protein
MPKAIFVLKSTIDDDGDDLHVAVAMHSESFSGGDDVIVDHP